MSDEGKARRLARLEAGKQKAARKRKRAASHRVMKYEQWLRAESEATMAYSQNPNAETLAAKQAVRKAIPVIPSDHDYKLAGKAKE